MPSRLLTSYQRNPVTITLCTLESTLRRAVTDLNNEEQGILYQQKVTLTDAQYQQIQQIILAATNEIARLSTTFSLPVEIRDSRSALQGQLAVQWNDLQDIRAEKLSSYGDIAPGLAAVLDPPVLHLIALVESLMHILSEKSPHHP